MKITVLGVVMLVAVLAAGAFTVRNRVKGADGPRIVNVDWTPPKTTLDPAYVDAVKHLLGNGLADPRGREFSQVKVELGDGAWNRVAVKEAYGWVSKDGKHAVLLDGVEYSIVSKGTPADPESVIREQGNDAISSSQFTKSPRRPQSVTRDLPRLNQAVRVDPNNPAFPALLLLVGRADLAEREFQPVNWPRPQPVALPLIDHLRQRYRMLAAQALIDKDDKLALHWADRLLALAMVAEKLKIEPSPSPSVHPVRLMEFAKAFYADMQRSVDEHRVGPVDVAGILKLPKPARIKALIANLDEVQARQWGQPGGLDYYQDPIFKALAEQGQDAVPALIETIASDKRYTRSVSFGRDFFPERSFHTVKDAAWNLLEIIWPSSSQYAADPYSVASADTLRTAWSKVGSLSEPERWLQVLRDDHAAKDQWFLAGQYLTKPADEIRLNRYSTLQGKPTSPMTGEPIRATHGAEVSRLMAQRAIQLASAHEGNSMDVFSCASALGLGHCLAKWDLHSSTGCLQTVCAKTLDTVHAYMQMTNARDIVGGIFGTAIADRLAQHDSSAAKDYGEMLDMVKPDGWFTDPNFFKPLWAAKSDPSIQRIGDRYMAAWAEAMAASDDQISGRAISATQNRVLDSELLTVHSFRHLLAGGIAMTAQFGSAKITGGTQGAPSYLQYRLLNGGGGSWNIPPKEDTGLTVGESIEFSAGDYFAQSISNGFMKGFPEYRIYWPNDKRAEARAHLIAWLNDDSTDWQAIVKTSPFSRMTE